MQLDIVVEAAVELSDTNESHRNSKSTTTWIGRERATYICSHQRQDCVDRGIVGAQLWDTEPMPQFPHHAAPHSHEDMPTLLRGRLGQHGRKRTPHQERDALEEQISLQSHAEKKRDEPIACIAVDVGPHIVWRVHMDDWCEKDFQSDNDP